MIELGNVRNPFRLGAGQQRDPSVHVVGDGRLLLYTRYAGGAWDRADSWSVGCAETRDFVEFADRGDLTPKGFASPGDVVFWGGRWVLPYQSYPAPPTRLFFSRSSDGRQWGEARPFLPEANRLPWNTRGRAIDPTFVVDGDALHCFFVGSCDQGAGDGRHANLLGHAVTRDAGLKRWEVLTVDEPLMGRSADAPDGVENVAVFHDGRQWVMIYSEDLRHQHLARAVSADLVAWRREGRVDVPVQGWMGLRHGAPFLWRDAGRWLMALMGVDRDNVARLGLLYSQDGRSWRIAPERT